MFDCPTARKYSNCEHSCHKALKVLEISINSRMLMSVEKLFLGTKKGSPCFLTREVSCGGAANVNRVHSSDPEIK